MKRRSSTRGISLMEILVSTSIASCVLGAGCMVYVQGTRSFYQEQSQSYVQFRTRTALERMATEARGAKMFLPTATLAGRTFASNDGTNGAPACMAVLVPSQDANGLFYYGAGSSTPNALATDIIVYWHDPSTRTLHRAVQPSVNVVTNDSTGSTRSSYRPAETDTLVAHDVTDLKFRFKDRNGQPIGTQSQVHIASVDLQARVSQTSASGNGLEQSTVAISGVRLRNMRSGSVPGCVMRGGVGVAGAAVTAQFTGSTGAYQSGSVVGNAVTDANGNFEVYGLEQGSYTIVVTPQTGSGTTVTGVTVPEEGAAPAVSVNLS
ncbi:MAG TPA: hypothetical protein VGM37_08310 [Armatimonadota bacterium]|jgi:Tfp pilus assembly protein PilW